MGSSGASQYSQIPQTTMMNTLERGKRPRQEPPQKPNAPRNKSHSKGKALEERGFRGIGKGKEA
jgi:hypothetical protein